MIDVMFWDWVIVLAVTVPVTLGLWDEYNNRKFYDSVRK